MAVPLGVRRTCRRFFGCDAGSAATYRCYCSPGCRPKRGSETIHSKLHRAINVSQVGLDSYIWAELLDAQIWKRPMRKGRHMRKRDAKITGEFRSIEEHQLMHQPRRKRSAVQHGAGFEQHAQDFASAKFGKHGVQIDAAAF